MSEKIEQSKESDMDQELSEEIFQFNFILFYYNFSDGIIKS